MFHTLEQPPTRIQGAYKSTNFAIRRDGFVLGHSRGTKGTWRRKVGLSWLLRCGLGEGHRGGCGIRGRRICAVWNRLAPRESFLSSWYTHRQISTSSSKLNPSVPTLRR